MNEQVKTYPENFSEDGVKMFGTLRQMIFDCAEDDIEEKMWAGMPSCCSGDRFRFSEDRKYENR